MPINSKIFGVGWRKPNKNKEVPSIPGRTARLKAINLLQIAAEVEHALMAQYLYAAYSLDEAFEQGSGQTTSKIDRWKRDIRTIARQEMAHFITVQNLLISLGAEVYVNRENNFSEHPDEYPFPVKFERFGLDPLAKYVVTESPDERVIHDKGALRLLHSASRRANRSRMQVKAKVNRVGLIYAALYWLFLESDNERKPWNVPVSVKRSMHTTGLKGIHIKDTDFVPLREYADFCATADEWEVFEDEFHVDEADPRRRALRAILWIMQQGEGLSGKPCSKSDSHFCRFLQIYRELEKDPSLAAAALPVPVNPVVLGTARHEAVKPGSQVITHPESKLWATLFNTRYQMLLLDVLLALSTNRNGQDSNLRKELTSWAAGHEMEHLKQIGQLLPTLPRDPFSAARAGAPFETVMFPPDNTKRWDQQRVLMKGSNELVRKLKKMIDPHDIRYTLLQKIEEFDRTRRKLVEKRSSLAEKRYEWRNGTNQRIADRT
jgi:rubrerythrin